MTGGVLFASLGPGERSTDLFDNAPTGAWTVPRHLAVPRPTLPCEDQAAALLNRWFGDTSTWIALRARRYAFGDAASRSPRRRSCSRAGRPGRQSDPAQQIREARVAMKAPELGQDRQKSKKDVAIFVRLLKASEHTVPLSQSGINEGANPPAPWNGVSFSRFSIHAVASARIPQLAYTMARKQRLRGSRPERLRKRSASSRAFSHAPLLEYRTASCPCAAGKTGFSSSVWKCCSMAWSSRPAP